MNHWWRRMNGRYWFPFTSGRSYSGWTMAIFHRRHGRFWQTNPANCRTPKDDGYCGPLSEAP